MASVALLGGSFPCSGFWVSSAIFGFPCFSLMTGPSLTEKKNVCLCACVFEYVTVCVCVRVYALALSTYRAGGFQEQNLALGPSKRLLLFPIFPFDLSLIFLDSLIFFGMRHASLSCLDVPGPCDLCLALSDRCRDGKELGSYIHHLCCI